MLTVLTVPTVPAPAKLAALSSRAVGSILGGAFQLAGTVRRSKPLHPKGAVLRGVFTRYGVTGAGTGADWLDSAGRDDVLVRFSRSAGLPDLAPDIQGLSIRILGPGRPADLLLSTTGRGVIGRHLLVPRRRPGAGFYGTLLPYCAGDRLLYLGAELVGPRRLPAGLDVLLEDVDARPAELRLLVADGAGPWRAFGTLAVTERASAGVDADVDFDPVLNPLPGLELPHWLQAVRAPAYAGARRSRQSRQQP